MKKCIALAFMLCVAPFALTACSSETTEEEKAGLLEKEFEEKSDEIAKEFTDMSKLDTTPHEDPPLF